MQNPEQAGYIAPESAPEVPLLIDYALRGLKSCWMPEHGRWSHIYHLDGRANPNETKPSSDIFYSLNVLVGLSRLSRYEKCHDFDIRAIFSNCVAEILKHKVPVYAYGTALWASAELGIELPENVRKVISDLIDSNDWAHFRAQDLGMLLAGCVRSAERAPDGQWSGAAQRLFKLLSERFAGPHGLFYDSARGFRRNFSSFATQTYLTLGCYIYGEWSNDKRALDLANACTAKLIELQGPQGEWPWFYYTPAGRVVDFYEVYSVHQQGMAPAFLAPAEKHGAPGAREALIKGFKWILGENQMKKSMLWKKESLICRSQVRGGELDNKFGRVARSMLNAATGARAQLADPASLQLRLECRSYELGWILYSFGPRGDLLELQNRPEFAA